MGSVYPAERDQTNVHLAFHANSFGGVTGLTVTVKLYDGDSLTDFVDFADGVFKAAGHTTPTRTLTEVGDGLYSLNEDFSAFTIPVATTKLLAVYEITAGDISGSDTDTIRLDNTVGSRSSHSAADVDTELTSAHGAGSWQQSVVTGASLNVVANASSTVTVGTVASGTYLSTQLLDGVYWQLQDVAGQLDMYFEFLIASDGIPTGISLTGRLNSGNDDLDVYAWNWGTTTWEQVGTLLGKGGAGDDVTTFFLFAQHVGTGVDSGKVRTRLYTASGLTSADLYVDQIILGYAVINRSVGYADGAIWIDTVNGTAGTVAYINGTADNPVLTLADAVTLATAVGLGRYRVASGSTLTLVSAHDGVDFLGSRWTLALGGQSISGTTIQGATVSGVCTGVLPPRFVDCVLNTVTLPASQARACGLAADITLADAGTYILDQCYSAVAGTGSPSLDFGAAVADTKVSMRHYSGGIEVRNMGQSGTDTMSLEGMGQILVAATCTGGTIAIRGLFPRTDLSGGAVTFSDDARLTRSELEDYLATDRARDVQIAVETASLDGTKITTARANNLDEITAARLAELDPANLPADVALVLSTGSTGPWTTGAGSTAQAVRDAMKLAPTAGAPAVGSLDAHLDDIYADTDSLDTTKITTGRANNLDEITAARLAELDPANLPADVALVLSTGSTGPWTSGGGGGLTQQQVRDAMKLAPTAGVPVAGSVDGHLDEINTDTDSLDTTKLTTARADNLDEITAARLGELDPANLPADIDTLIARLTAARALLLDNLSELAAGNVPADVDALTTAVALVLSTGSTGPWSTGAGIGAQAVRDAMKLAPTAGAPATGSIDDDLDAMKGTGFVTGTDSLEAVRDRGDAAWTTFAGIGGLTAQQTRDAMKLAPSAGAPASGSIDADLDTLLAGVTITAGERTTLAGVIRDIGLAGSAVGSLGEGILVAKNAKLFFRLDNFVRDPVTGFALSVRLRVFPDTATSSASTQDAAGLEGAISSATITGEANLIAAFAVLPQDVVGT